MSSTNRILRIVAAMAFTGMTGCASVISSLADPSLEKQFPAASVNRDEPAGRYETPIPHQYRAYTSTSLREQQRQFERTAIVVDAIDTIKQALANLSPFGASNVRVSSIADGLCGSGSRTAAGSDWMGAATLQPMALKEAVARSRCWTAFRDLFVGLPPIGRLH